MLHPPRKQSGQVLLSFPQHNPSVLSVRCERKNVGVSQLRKLSRSWLESHNITLDLTKNRDSKLTQVTLFSLPEA